jgi:hypothetical protein
MPYLGNPVVDRFTSTKAASVYSGDGSTVAFTLEHSIGSDEDILVSVDGVIQEPSVAYAVSNGTTLTFTAAPSTNAGNNIFVYYLFRTIGTVTHPPTSALSATSLNTSGNVVHNEAGADVDFRVESDGNANMLFVDGGTDRVGIGVASPTQTLDVAGSSQISFESGVNTYQYFQSTSNYIGRATDGNLNINVAGGQNILFGIAGAERMRIDATGAVTMPLQPAFLAKPASLQTNLALNTDVTIVFGTEIFDQNGDFASNTFTAPVTGKYQINVHIYFNALDQDGTFYEIKIITSLRNHVHVIDMRPFDADAPNWSFNASVLTDMDASDTAYIAVKPYNTGAAQADVAVESYFSGYLVA